MTVISTTYTNDQRESYESVEVCVPSL